MKHLAGFLLLTLFSCSDAEVGSASRPFTMYFVPSVDAETIALSADAITQFVEREVSQALHGKDTGFHIKSAIPSSYVAVVEALGTGRADFAALNTFSFILAKDIKKYPVDPIVRVVRGDGESSYKSQILTRVGSGIETLQDLNGKSFAFTDPASTAGFILPSHHLKQNKVKLGETVFAMKHDNVVTQIYQGQVDAGATYFSPPKNGKIRDARARVKTQFPDVEDKVKILAFTEETPNEPWVIRANLSADPERNRKIRNAVREALLKFSATEEGKKSLDELYDITGLAPVNDSVYTSIRKLILESELDLESSIR